MNFRRLTLIVASLCSIASCGRKAAGEDAEQRPDPILGFYTEDFVADTSEVVIGETFTGLMCRLGMGASSAYDMVQICDTVFDVRKLRAGNRIVAYYSPDSLRTLQYAVYDNDRIRSTIVQCSDSLAVWTYDKPVTIETKTCDVTIHTSLWNDMVEAGISPLLIVELSDIYAWTVNFFGLQEGDRFRAIYDQKVCEGEVLGVSKVDFCIFNAGGKDNYAIRFDQHDGGNVYWNENGESLKKAFLKAPLKFNRISSRFSYARKHPVTGKVRAHTAVDYAAPSGTPVHAIGDGVVTLCGWDSHGGGNRIRIKHVNGYETAYLHLSKFAKGIRNGAHVSQGQTIGYVGSTGMSTGPHLDFRVWKDGKPVDPLKMISPPAAPLAKENLDSLQTLFKHYCSSFDGD